MAEGKAATHNFVEELGKVLMAAQEQTTGWVSQRDSIIGQLTSFRDTANKLLADMGVISTNGHGPAAVPPSQDEPRIIRRRRRRRAIVAGTSVPSVRKRAGMSPAARKAVSARMKKYWAAKRKAMR